MDFGIYLHDLTLVDMDDSHHITFMYTLMLLIHWLGIHVNKGEGISYRVEKISKSHNFNT